MCLNPITIKARPKGAPSHIATVKCGKCLQCAQEYSIEWSYRILDECTLHERNCFITLTFNEENLPSPPTVSRRDVQLFMKSLRQEIAPLKIRFFACGEYGKKNKRPHYHFIIFGWFPNDCYEWQREDGYVLYRSPTLEKVWKKGFSLVGEVTERSALYCAKYMNKFSFRQHPQGVPVVVENEVTPFFDYLSPPFVQMSNRPGIGYGCVYNSSLEADRIYRNGHSIKIPRYYLKVMEQDGIFLDEFKERRQLTGALLEKCSNIEDRRKKFFEKFNKKVLT